MEEKETAEHIDQTTYNLRPQHTYYTDTGDAEPQLSESHRAYLIERHGTIDLDPLPSADPADPYNWPAWKKNTNLALVSFHACMTTFIAAGVIPAFQLISEDLHISIEQTSYLASMNIAVLGGSPLFWQPISNRYGRRPIWLISTILTGVCNVGCAVSHSYAAMSACRCLGAFFISPAIALGSGVVVETFFKKERGQKMGIWALMGTLGPPAGPFIMGFVAKAVGYRWIYWIFAITNVVQFIGYFFFGPETRYLRAGVKHTGSAFKQEYLTFGRLDPAPFKWIEFLQPVFLGRYFTVLLPTIAYAIVFSFAGIFLTIEIPQIFIPKFHFDPQQLGLQFLGMIIGSFIGEIIGGVTSDLWMARANARALRVGRPKAAPEFRLWLSYFGFLFAIVGLIVFGVRTEQAPTGHWNVTPIVGIGIASVGNQIVTTVLMTYAVDCHQEQSSSVGVFINLLRSTWGFVGPFFFPDMIEKLGIAGSSGLMAGIIFPCCVLPVLACQFFLGKRERKEDRLTQNVE